MQSENHQVVERRAEPVEKSLWWSKLSLAQKFSASSLGKFGYELNFVRNDKGQKIAFLFCNDGIATINEEGEINTSPNTKVRFNSAKQLKVI